MAVRFMVIMATTLSSVIRIITIIMSTTITAVGIIIAGTIMGTIIMKIMGTITMTMTSWRPRVRLA